MKYQKCLGCEKPILTPNNKYPTNPQPEDEGRCGCSHYIRTSSDWRWNGITEGYEAFLVAFAFGQFAKGIMEEYGIDKSRITAKLEQELPLAEGGDDV